MDFSYLRLRIQTFRREYFDISSKWLKNSWSWLWNFSIDNCKYLYLGEINQIKYLSNSVRQQQDYIDLIQSDPFDNKKPIEYRDPGRTTLVEKALKMLFIIFLLPLGFLVYWVRRIIRIILRKRFHLLVSAINPTEDMALEAAYQGNARSVFLIPGDTRLYPRGLVIFNYSLTVAEGVAEPRLYIDPGVGFTADYTIALPYDSRQAEQELLLELPPHCRLLEFEAAPEPVNIQLNNVCIRETGFFHAAWYLKQQYHYGINEILHALFIRKLPGVRRTRADKCSYPQWHRAYAQLSAVDKATITRHIQSFINPPLISVVINTDNAHPELLDLCLKTLIAQLYPNWELLITCHHLPDAHVTSVLNKYERNDNRVRIIIDAKIAQISNNIPQALQQCQGQYTVLLECKDLLTAHALYLFAWQIQKNPNAKLIYSDYDHINPSGALFEPCFKPDWNYDFFLGKNYLQYLVCYQTTVLKEVLNNTITDPFRQASHVNIAIIERLNAPEIMHIPYVLLHHRSPVTAPGSGSYDERQHDMDALNAHFVRTGQTATAIPVKSGFWIKRTLNGPEPLLSLIVLTRDRASLLSNCIHGLLHKTAYKNIEIIIIDNGSVEQATLSFLDAIGRDQRVKVHRHPSEFNFSELNNFGFEHASGDYIGLINNDISVIEPDWLDEMMGHLIREDVGVVGAKLLYENDTIQHAGVITGLGGVAGHNFRHEPRHARGYDDRLLLSQELSCVTAACMLTKNPVYRQVGGLDPVNLRIAFNDVDYCLKVRELGLKVIWTPFAELYHLESASRDSDLSKDNIHRWDAEYTFMRDKWRQVLERDPFYNPNLAIADEDFSLAIPPRLTYPWERYRFVQTNNEIVHDKAV